MKVQLIAVGGKMPAWVQAGYEEFNKRLPKELTPQLVELPLAQRSKNSDLRKVKALEGQAILNAMPKPTTKVFLDVKGKPWSTETLAENLKQWQMAGQDLAFVIGGPDGFDEECLLHADAKWSMSNLTLPHPLVRIVFIEQLYRAWTILQNHPYHK